VPEATGGYVNALQVEGASRLLFMSGQIPQTREGHVPDRIEDQCRLVWAHLTAALAAAAMDVTNLVKVTTILSDREYAAANTDIRNEVLGDHRPALTAIVAGIWDPSWLIEIEAVAAACVGWKRADAARPSQAPKLDQAGGGQQCARAGLRE
jgi:2-iminobutanoate/2-iminopropanoate deaminase